MHRPELLAKFHSLHLQDLVLWVHLGCTELERKKPQEVRVHIDLQMKNPPRGIFTDRLEDTLCYAKISEKVIRWCESREFQLIERMAADIYVLVKKYSGSETEVRIQVHKVRPPVERLQGGSRFQCGDFL